MTQRTASLRTRLAVSLGLLFLAGMVALYAAARTYAGLAADRSFDRLLAGSALSIAETLSITDSRISVDIPYAALDMLSSAPDDRVFYRVGLGSGQTVTGYADLPPPPPQTARSSNQMGEQLRFYNAPYRGEAVRFVSLLRPISRNGIAQTVNVEVGQTRRARADLARDLLIGALAPIGLMTLLALAVVWFGITIALRPLERIVGELSARKPDALGELQTPVPADLAPLVDALNDFMQRLSQSIDLLKNFIAEAAHQIRTPLATISAQAQLADTDDPAEQAASIAAIQRNARRLTRLVNQLLSDATTIHRSNLRQFARFDLLEVVRRAIRESVPLHEDSDVRLTSPLPEAPYRGDELLIGEAVKNMIQNALLHGRGEEGEVLLTLTRQADSYVLEVSDRGPGIPPERREQVFRRYARGDSKATGVGLGMAIIARVVEAHRGNVSLLDREGGGLTVHVRLPTEERA